MNGCCFNPIRAEIIGIIETTPPEPPVESNWCVQYATVITGGFGFPCGEENEINGNTNSGEICGGNFFLTDFRFPDHTFYYTQVSSNFYCQIIRPASDPALTDLGSYSYFNPFLGENSGPITIVPTDQNCVLRTFQAVFEVDDPSTDGLSGLAFDDFSHDIVAPFYPFDTPNVGDLYLNDNIGTGRIGPEGTVDVQISGNEITLTIQSLIGIASGVWSTVSEVPQTNFPFTEI